MKPSLPLLAKPPNAPPIIFPAVPPPNDELTPDATPPARDAPLIDGAAALKPFNAPLAAPLNPPAYNPSYAPARAASPPTAKPPVKAPVPIDPAIPAIFSIGIVCPKPSVSLDFAFDCV